MTAPAPRPTSSATPWSSETARSTSGSSPRTATTPSTRTCSSRGRPTVDRRSCRAPCRSTSRAVRGLRRRHRFGHHPAHAFPRTEHSIPGLQPADRQAVVRLPEQRQPADLAGRHLLPDLDRRWAALVRLAVPVDRFIRPAGRQRPVLPVGRSDESGRFYVIWFDRRLDPANVRINTWQAVSSNDAASFSSSKISTQDSDPNHRFFTSGAFIGDYNGLAASTEPCTPCGRTARRCHRSDRHRRNGRLHQVPEEPVARISQQSCPRLTPATMFHPGFR